MAAAGPPLVYCTAEYAHLRDRLATGDRSAGRVKRVDFPDGERLLRIEDDVFEREVIVVGGTTSDATTLELYDLACGAVTLGALRLTLVLPYFGYSTMEREVHRGDVVTAKNRARLLSSIPQSARGNRALLFDLHSEGIPHYFEGHLATYHVRGMSIAKEVAIDAMGDDFVMACTDAGRAKWVESLANEVGVEASFVFKRRLSGSETEVVAVDARVDGKDVVIYDDMIRTGGSMVQAARAFRAAGAQRMIAIATHALLPGESLTKIRDAGCFEKVVVTDSHPRALALADDFLEVRPIAQLFEPLLD